MPIVRIPLDNGKQILSDLERLCSEDLKCSTRLKKLLIAKYDELIAENKASKDYGNK